MDFPATALFLKIAMPLWLSLKVAGIATVCATVCGVMAAWIISRFKFPGREWLDSLLALPLVLPPTVMGYYLLVLVGRNSVIGSRLYSTFGFSLVFTWQGAVLAAALVSLPLVYKSARTAFEGIDSRFEDAARTLGLSEVDVFVRISLPLAWRGITAGAMLAFARAMGEFGATLMVAGNLPGKTQTLSLAVYDAVQSGNDVLAGVLVGATSLACAAVLVGSGKLMKTSWLRDSGVV
jgi:molybdate transport system permease protein